MTIWGNYNKGLRPVSQKALLQTEKHSNPTEKWIKDKGSRKKNMYLSSLRMYLRTTSNLTTNECDTHGNNYLPGPLGRDVKSHSRRPANLLGGVGGRWGHGVEISKGSEPRACLTGWAMVLGKQKQPIWPHYLWPSNTISGNLSWENWPIFLNCA